MNTHRINPVGDDNLVDHHSWSGPPSVRGPATADLPSGPNLARCRSALYVDFDNVFSGLHQVNPDLAHAFAGHPDRWLDRLAGLDAGWGRRDFLVRRVYLNPGGSIAVAGGDRVYFSRFRQSFVACGFEVVDCPGLTSSHKNAADIRIALDVMDAASNHLIDEFIVASSDSDFTPLLHRLRASDHRTAILSTCTTSGAFRSCADLVIDNGAMATLIDTSCTGEPINDHVERPGAPAPVLTRAAAATAVPSGSLTGSTDLSPQGR